MHQRRTIRISALFITLAALLLPATATAEPGFQPRIGGITISSSQATLGGAFRADGVFEALVGAGSSQLGLAEVRDGAFEDAIDWARFTSDGTVVNPRVAMDEDGNRVVAWRADCAAAPLGECIMAATRSAGSGWSAPTVFVDASEYASVEVAIADGVAIVAYEQDAGGGGQNVRPVAVERPLAGGGEWSEPVNIAPYLETGGSGRLLQGITVDAQGFAWVVLTYYANGEPYESTAMAARRDGNGAWSAKDVGDHADPNGLADIGFDDELGVIAWVTYAGDVVAVSCGATLESCGADDTHVFDEPDHGHNPRVAVSDDGEAVVQWTAGQYYMSNGALRAAIGELQDDELVWDAPEHPDASAIEVAASSTAGRAAHDVAFTTEGELLTAWLSTDASGWPIRREAFGAVREASGNWSATGLAPADEFNYVSMAPALSIVTDPGSGDAAVLFPFASEAAVAPWDVTAPDVSSAGDVTLSAGEEETLTVQVRDTWSAVAAEDVRWSLDDGELAATGRSITGCFDEPGTHDVEVVATDAAGNESVPHGFQVTVVGSGSCDEEPPTPGGGTGGGTTTPPPTTPPPTTPKPNAFTTKTTVSRGTVPNVKGLKASTARDRFTKAGIEADFTIRMVQRAKAPKGIDPGEVMTQKPRAGAKVTTAIRDAEPVRLEVYAGPRTTGAARCSTATVSKAVKGLELDLAALMLKAMKCPYRVDVKPVSTGNDASVTAAKQTKQGLVLTAAVPKQPKRNDLFLNFRENPNGISFDHVDWTLTAGQPNAFTFQVVDRGFRLVRKAKVIIDGTAVGLPKPLVGETDRNGEKITVLTPRRAGIIDILVELRGADGQSIWGYAQVKVKDRSAAKTGTWLTTISGRTFQKAKDGVWRAGQKPRSRHREDARIVNVGGLLAWMHQLVTPLSDSIRNAFAPKGATPEQTLSTALRTVKVSPAQLALASPLVGGKVEMARVTAGQVVSAGGGNVVAVGGGNVIAAGGANVVSAGGGNVVAVGGGNVVAAGGLNLINAAGAGVVAAGGLNVIAAGGGNVVAAGGGNVVAVGGGNVVAAGGLN